MSTQSEVAIIVGGGPGISASCARLFSEQGMHKVGIGLCLNVDFFDSLGTVFVRKRDKAHVVFVEGVGV